jgi:hypothetical protein
LISVTTVWIYNNVLVLKFQKPNNLPGQTKTFNSLFVTWKFDAAVFQKTIINISSVLAPKETNPKLPNHFDITRGEEKNSCSQADNMMGVILL